jgi:arylsulfatase A-like enzyme
MTLPLTVDETLRKEQGMKYSWVLAVFIFAWLCGACMGAQKPNVVMVFIDDMGYADVGAFGNPVVETPHMDRLAREGTKFTNFYVNSPICSASRVALNAGIYPQRERIHSFFASRKENRKRKMPDWLTPERYTYARMLKQNGYATAHFGKWHMGGGRDVGDAPLPQAYGYEESLVSVEGLGDRIIPSDDRLCRQSRELGRGNLLEFPKHKTTETYVDRAIDFMERNQARPFLVNVFPNDVHDSHEPSDQQYGKWSSSSENPYEQKFFAVLDEMDRQIGRLLNAIDELGLAGNTIVILTSDNGPTDWKRYYNEKLAPPGFTGPFFGRKWSLYEGGIRMPFMIRWPERIPAGKTNDESILTAMDLLPSLAGLLGLEIPDGVVLDGVDLSNAWRGEGVQRGTPVFWEYGVYGSIVPGKPEHISPQLAMRDGGWKFMMNPDGSEMKLFNLLDDSGEKHNLINANPEKAATMRRQLDDWWRDLRRVYRNV